MHLLSSEELRRIYPESDGKPIAENTLQFEWITLIKLNLEAWFVQVETAMDEPFVGYKIGVDE